MSESEPPQEANAATPRHNDTLPQSTAAQLRRMERWLTNGEIIIQMAAGALLLLAALLAIGYAVYHFFEQIATATLTLAFPSENIHLTTEQNLAAAITNLISDLLLVLIIGEVFNTVLHYLRERTVYIKPFFFIGIISAARDILSISARITVLEVQEKEFVQLMIELGVNLGIILGLSLALRIIRKEDASDPL